MKYRLKKQCIKNLLERRKYYPLQVQIYNRKALFVTSGELLNNRRSVTLYIIVTIRKYGEKLLERKLKKKY